MDLLRPSLEMKVAVKQAEQKNYHDAHSKAREFIVGETVLAQNLQGEPKWLKGTVLEKAGPVSYKVQVGDRIWRRHVDLLSAESTTKNRFHQMTMCTPQFKLSKLHRTNSRILLKRTLILKLHRKTQTSWNLLRLILQLQLELLVTQLELIIPLSIFASLISSF